MIAFQRDAPMTTNHSDSFVHGEIIVYNILDVSFCCMKNSNVIVSSSQFTAKFGRPEYAT